MTARSIAVSEGKDYFKTRRLVLPDLLQQVEEGRLKNLTAQRKLSNCPYFIRRLQLQNCLEGHRGCVNTVSFCERLLISGSDDRTIKLWDWQLGKKVLTFDSGHIDNVFQARFIPATSFTIASSSADGQVRASVLSNDGISSSRRLWQHDGRAHKIALSIYPSTFLSCGEDGSIVFHDVRQKHPAANVCVFNSTRRLELYSINTNPNNRSEFCVGGQQKDIIIFDLRKYGDSKRAIHLCSFRPCCLKSDDVSCTAAIYNRKGEILASYNDDFIYLFNRSIHGIPTLQAIDGQDESSGRTFQPPAEIHQLFSSSASIVKSNVCDKQAYTVSPMLHAEVFCMQNAEDDNANYLDTYDEILRNSSNSVSNEEDSSDDVESLSDTVISSTSNEETEETVEMESEEETDCDGDPSDQLDDGGFHFSVENGVSNVFLGHRNQETIKGVAFLGVDDEWVISGSDCGYIYIWSASTGNCHASFKADSYVVNCLEPNAQHFLTFATSGIDNDIKLWSPTRENPVSLEYTDLQRMESNVEGVLSASIGRKSRSTAARLMRRIALVGGAQE